MQESMKKQLILILNEKDYKIEIDPSITIKALKKLAKNMLNLERNSFALFYNDKEIIESDTVKLTEIFDLIKEIRVRISLTRERKGTRSKSEKKLKYMLECSLHTNENAHYYCFTCSISFCTVCSIKHSSHDIIDKYIYCKTSDELVHSVMDDIVVCISQHEEEMKQFDKESSLTSIETQFKQIKDIYLIISEEYQNNLMEKSLSKINNFKKDFFNFRENCLAALNETKSKRISDLIILEDDYFLNLHKTIKEFNISKLKLIEYLKQIKKEYNEEKNEVSLFAKEISDDMKLIVEKMKAKMQNLTKNGDKNILTKASSKFSSDFIDNNYSNIGNNSNSIIKRRIGKSEVIIYDFLTKAFEKRRIKQNNINYDNLSAIPTERASTNFDRNSQYSDLVSQYSVQLSHVTSTNNILTNCNINANNVITTTCNINTNNNLETNEKILNLNRKRSSISNIEKFLPFSVYLNIDNNLYISGGKRNEECVKDFLFYSQEKNSIVKLEPMRNPRCSHAMAFVPPNDIYVVGGYCNNTTEKYSITDKKWRQLSSLNFKERQVPTLILVNYRYLFCFLGYINTNVNDQNDYVEKFDTFNMFSAWELFKVNNGKNVEMKIFNAGCILINQNEVIICGGEKYQGSETDKCFLFNFSSLETSDSDAVLPQPTSFLEKLFIANNKGKFCQFEMKKNNLYIYNQVKNKFKIKMFN